MSCCCGELPSSVAEADEKLLAEGEFVTYGVLVISHTNMVVPFMLSGLGACVWLQVTGAPRDRDPTGPLPPGCRRRVSSSAATAGQDLLALNLGMPIPPSDSTTTKEIIRGHVFGKLDSYGFRRANWLFFAPFTLLRALPEPPGREAPARGMVHAGPRRVVAFCMEFARLPGDSFIATRVAGQDDEWQATLVRTGGPLAGRGYVLARGHQIGSESGDPASAAGKLLLRGEGSPTLWPISVATVSHLSGSALVGRPIRGTGRSMLNMRLGTRREVRDSRLA
ncbi:hypothetical protein PG985_016008 [Apiospora marii]|uniref:uncharacterized protein n=1 Tax=Apiospora marii TaxID=335849 RepID=UPI00312CD372